MAHIHAMTKWAAEREELLATRIIVHPTDAEAFSNPSPIIDTNQDLHAAYHAQKTCFFMIRPDNYIGCCSTEFDMQLLNIYWTHIFHS